MALRLAAAADGLELRLKGPERVQRGRPFSIEFTVANAGKTGFYFKLPWRWASNGLYLRAIGEDGAVIDSETLLYDIATARRCTFFKAIGPDESFAFRVELGLCSGCPDLRLPKPGRYRVKWL